MFLLEFVAKHAFLVVSHSSLDWSELRKTHFLIKICLSYFPHFQLEWGLPLNPYLEPQQTNKSSQATTKTQTQTTNQQQNPNKFDRSF